MCVCVCECVVFAIVQRHTNTYTRDFATKNYHGMYLVVTAIQPQTWDTYQVTVGYFLCGMLCMAVNR